MGALDFWHSLPTAWVHFLVVECLAIWAAIGSWILLVTKMNATAAMRTHWQNGAALNTYFQHLFFLGSVGEKTINYTNVSDDFFADEKAEAIQWKSIATDDTMICSLTLPATQIEVFTATGIWLFSVNCGEPFVTFGDF